MIQAKFCVDEVSQTPIYGYNTKTSYNEIKGISEKVIFHAVDDDGLADNARFHNATPSGQLQMVIDNQAAIGYFKPGCEYYLTFKKAE